MSGESYYPEKCEVSKFFEELKKGKVMTTRCNSCGTVNFPPKMRCPYCGGRKMNWTELDGEAEVVSYTVVHTAPERWKDLVPYVVALGQLKEGPVALAVLEGIDSKDVEIGMNIKLVSSERAKNYPEPAYKYKFVSV